MGKPYFHEKIKFSHTISNKSVKNKKLAFPEGVIKFTSNTLLAILTVKRRGQT